MRLAGAASVLVVGLTVLRSLDSDQASAYASAVYVPLTRTTDALITPAPWSWTMVLLAAALVAIGVLAARRGVRACLIALALGGLAAWTWGTAAWGVHYQRAPWADGRSLPAGDAAEEARVTALARALRDVVVGAESELRSGGRDPEVALAAIAAALEQHVAQDDGLTVQVPKRVKVVPAGLLLGFGTSGVISPWLLEAHVDGGLPDAARVAVGAHELAHVAGHAREDDAEVAGAIAGLRAADPFARYAVGLFQLAAAVRALPPAEGQRMLDALPEVAQQDLRRAREASERYVHPRLAAAQRWIYDRYLRAQGIPEGVASYARSTSLLARALAAGELRGPTGVPP